MSSKVIQLRIKKRRKELKKGNTDPFEIRDLRDKFFMVDDAYLNGWARLFESGVSMVYFALCRHVGADQTCFPSIAFLSEKLGMGPHTVIKSIKLLELHRLIKVDRVKGQPNIYWLTDKKKWKKIIRVTPKDFTQDGGAEL
jgi:hypothetical protein